MKNQSKSKKYEQLVETQSPEPQELEEGLSKGMGEACELGDNGEERLGSEGRVSNASNAHVEQISSLSAANTNKQKLSKANKQSDLETDNKTSQGYLEQEARNLFCEQATQVGPPNIIIPQADSQDRRDSLKTCDSLTGSVVSTNSAASFSRSAEKMALENEKASFSIDIRDQLGGQANELELANLRKLASSSVLNELEMSEQAKSQHFEISWKNLSFSYKSKSNFLTGWLSKKPCQVLKDISGGFRSNQLVAIIGPSGCGKTTLLQFLAGDNASSKEKLKIVGLEEPKVAFIGQDDCLLPGLTARETLLYASRLQNTGLGFDHQAHVAPIISALGLSECADRSVTKLSGGQAKRVTIGQELLYPTNLLILDEVTSGLDASTSYSIVKLLKELVSNREYPMTIVISIHQPSARLFSVFDQVYVMSDGHCLYEGSCRVELINNYLRGFGLECPQYHNMADYLIEIACETDCSSGGQKNYKLSDNILAIKDQMIQYQRMKSAARADKEDDSQTTTMVVSTTTAAALNIDKSLNDNSAQDHDNETTLLINRNSSVALYDAIKGARLKRPRPFTKHLLVHLQRSILRISRSSILTYLQLFTYILLGLQLATFYGPEIGSLSGCPQLPQTLITFALSSEVYESINSEMRRLQENINFLLVAVMTATFAALEITVITFPMEARTIKREWRNGWYRTSSYFTGRTLADMPFQLTFVVVFCTIVYTLTGQAGFTSWRFSSFVLVIIMTALVAQTVGFIFGALFMDNLPAAVFTAPLFIFPALLFSGFFSSLTQMPLLYRPLAYLSHFKYVFDSLLVTLYGFDRCHCDQDALSNYHANLENQTGNIKQIFNALFGSSDCVTAATTKTNPASVNFTYPSNDENSIEDAPPSTIPESAFASALPFNFSSTSSPLLPSSMRSLEDSLVDTVFEHMLGYNTTPTPRTSSTPSNHSPAGDVTDLLAHKFSNRVTKMLNSQANFGHEVPTECQNFNPYLMNEFDLHNQDLIKGLLVLFIYVVVSRLICNLILSYTISTRVK